MKRARYRGAQKRGSGNTIYVSDLDEFGQNRDDLLFALNEALDRLAIQHPRKAQLVEMRYFGGMPAEECATALSVSLNTVRRELRFSQAWLRRELASSGTPMPE
jgi:RNA polymerase sigma-70 factor (ECF subfamily)